MAERLIEEFLTWKRAGQAAASTLKQRRAILRQINTRWPLDQLTASQATAWLTDPSRGPHAARQGLHALRTFYRWAIATGRLTHDPTALLHPIREPHSLPRPTPRAAITHALDQADEPARAAIMLGYRAGLRRSEIATLHARAVTPDGLRILGKGNRERLVPIHSDLRPYLRFTDWRFPSPRWPDRHAHPDYVADLITATTGYSPHGLRHRFATDVYAQTGDLRSLQVLLGHASIQTTQRYVEIADERLSAVVHALT